MKNRPRNRKQARPISRHFSGAGAVLATGCLLAAPQAQAQNPASPPPSNQSTNAPAKPVELAKASDTGDTELNNWVETGLGGNMVSGSKAAYQQQTGLPTGAFGGITSFHYEQPVDKTGEFSLDGRGMFDNHDYSLKLQLSKPDTGYFRVGYNEFREYYDAAGGYFPTSTGGLSFPNTGYYVDRSDFFVEAGITKPDWPMVKFRYDHMTRDGDADSTSYGTTLQPGGSSQIKITPAYLGMNDTRDIFAFDVSRPFGSTTVGVGVTGELDHNKDSYNVLMEPTAGASHTLTQALDTTAGMVSAHTSTDTKLADNLRFTTGYSFSSLNSDITGAGYDTPIPGTTSATDSGRYQNLVGALDIKEYVANMSLLYTPWEDFSIVPAIRFQTQNQTANATDNPINTSGVVYPLNYGTSDTGETDVLQSLDLRYTGVTNWAFYARTEFAENQGTINQWSDTPASVLLTSYAPTYANTDWSEVVQKYTIGANWYPLRHLNFGFQYYHKVDGNRYDYIDSSSAAQYPSFLGVQNFYVDDFNFRANWRICPQLSIVTRYDFELASVETQPFGLPKIDSGDETKHMISETLSWTPLNRMYVQVGVNYVLDHTITPAQYDTAVSGIILESRNNYYTGNCTVGYALDKKTDLAASYSYYRSDDYMDTAPAGLPLGAGGRETNISATLRRQINQRWSASVRYAFADYNDQLFGGVLNFKANSVLATLRFRF
jgi:hypothetical protein